MKLARERTERLLAEAQEARVVLDRLVMELQVTLAEVTESCSDVRAKRARRRWSKGLGRHY